METVERSISVIVTAMNEGGNLEPTVRGILRSIAPLFPLYEVIIVDDGSRDQTPKIADALAAENPHIVVHHNPRNMGLASAYRTGIELARYHYTSWIAGNNLIPPAGFDDIYSRVGEADIVTTYLLIDVRGTTRRNLSTTFTRAMNLLFGTNLRYFTGPCVYRTAAVKRVKAVSHGTMFVAEVLLRLVLAGETCTRVGIHPLPRTSGATKSFRLKNVAAVLFSVARLFWILRVMRRSQLSSPDTAPVERNHLAAL